MSDPRWWAGCVLALGIAIGTMTDDVGERVVPRSGEYAILAGDFHVHGGPGDGTLLPWELHREARRAGLDALAITNHNTTYAARVARWWSVSFPSASLLILVGEEITSPDYHMAAVGITRTVSRRQSAASAIEEIHAQGGVAIAAHPSRKYWGGYDDRALALLDGVESANASNPTALRDYAEFLRRAREGNPDVAAIGSSDFHGSPRLARCRTYLLVRERSEAGVLEAIRAGRTVAQDQRGLLYGEPGLVRLVEANRPAGRSDAHPAWRRLSVMFAWAGLLGLILLPAGRRSL